MARGMGILQAVSIVMHEANEALLSEHGGKTREWWQADCNVVAEETIGAHLDSDLPHDLRPLFRIHRDDDGNVPPERLWGAVEAANRAGWLDQCALPGQPAFALHAGRSYLIHGWRKLGADGTPNEPDETGHTFVVKLLQFGIVLQIDSTRQSGPRARLRQWTDVLNEFEAGIAIGRIRLR